MIVIKKYKYIFIFRIINKLYEMIYNLRQLSRYSLLAKSMAYVGEGVRFDDNVYLNYPENITIFDDVFIGKDTILNAFESIVIEKHVIIAASCKLITANHHFEDIKTHIKSQGYSLEPICIGEGSWLGYGAIILPGVTLGKGCVVAAGAVVTKSFAPYSILAGVPARLIKYRGDSDNIE
jgi:acetyltransferase-like isoleucine patch superfamily enzyme